MPEISRFYGIVIYIFFNDINPPHFHVNYQGYNAMIEIETGTISGEFPRRPLKLVHEWLDLNKQELLDNWQKMLERKPLNKIQPLK